MPRNSKRKTKVSKEKRARKAPMSRTLMPAEYPVTLRYASTNKIGSAGLDDAYTVWGLNNLYDVDYSSSGHQPRGFDQFANLYTNYLVQKVTVNLQACNVTVSPIICGLVPYLALPSTVDSWFLMETVNSVYSLTSPAGGYPLANLTHVYQIKDIAGTSSLTTKDVPYTGTFTSGPDKPVFLALILATTDGTTLGAGALAYTISFQFEAVLFGRKAVDYS